MADLRKAFCQRWNAYGEGTPILYPYQFDSAHLFSLIDNSLTNTTDLPVILPTLRENTTTCHVQIVRSITGPSAGKGFFYKGQGIRDAYCDIIRTAESFVCIFRERW